MALPDRGANPNARIRLSGRRFDLYIPLGDGPVIPTAGGATVGEVARPDKPPLTESEGDALIRLSVPAFWDGWPDENVWPDIEAVVSLAFGGDDGRLPDFTASGPMPYSGRRFQMEAPEYGEGKGSPHGGRFMVQQNVTIKLVEFNDPDVINFRKRRRTGIGPNVALRTRLPAEETLLQVAARIFGKPGMAQKIGELNGIRDIRAKLPAGRVLKLPRED